MYFIYCVTNKENGKRYIGKTGQMPSARWEQHIADSRREDRADIYFYRAIRKYGPDGFNVSIIDTALVESEINELEKKYIADLKTHDPILGYNGTFGGEGGRQTPEILIKMGAAISAGWTPEKRKLKSETYRGVTHPSFGKPMKEETKVKISLSKVGKSLSPEHVEKVRQAGIGRKHSEETKLKMSVSRKKIWEDPEYQKKQTETHLGKKRVTA